MSRLALLIAVVLVGGCDSAEPPVPVPYAEADEKPVPVEGWDAVGAAAGYPEFASRAGIEGEVVVGFVVTEAGETDLDRVLVSPNDLLSEAAVRAVEAAAFVPGREAGVVVSVAAAACVRFRLGEPTTAGFCDR